MKISFVCRQFSLNPQTPLARDRAAALFAGSAKYFRRALSTYTRCSVCLVSGNNLKEICNFYPTEALIAIRMKLRMSAIRFKSRLANKLHVNPPDNIVSNARLFLIQRSSIFRRDLFISFTQMWARKQQLSFGRQQ